MPKRLSRAARARATVRAQNSVLTPELLAGLLPGAAASFQPGLAVVAADDPGRVGTVCRVVTAGRSYQVRFADSPICMLTPHAAIVAAPVGTAGPGCTPDC
jgi:hypothetical protein